MKNKNAKDIATRMKEYEKSSKHHLTPRVPVMLRIDGRAFHTFTKGFVKPFDDEILLKAMRQTMKTLCEMIPGCVLGYTQSDEITLVILDQNTQAEPWFGFCQNKIESITASMATMVFNQTFYKAYQNYDKRLDFAVNYYKNIIVNLQRSATGCVERINFVAPIKLAIVHSCDVIYKKQKVFHDKYEPKLHTAMFDCRAFNIPREEICNNLIWRQQDATRNSIQQVARTYFSHSELNNLSCDEIQEKLFQEKNINWNNYPTRLKRGSCCVRKDVFFSADEIKKKNPLYDGEGFTRKKWVIDTEIPVFTQNREYIEEVL